MALIHEGLIADIGKYLTCSICFEIFTDPVTLSCGHSYCMKCLDAFLRGKAKKNCPDCRSCIRPGLKRNKNVTLCNIVTVHHDHKCFVSNEESTRGHEIEVDFKEDIAEECVASHSQQTDINRPSELGSTIQQQQVEAPVVTNDTNSELTDDRYPDVSASHDGRVQELPISPPSNDRHSAEGFSTPHHPPHPLPGASFSWLTFNPALGHRRLTFQPKEHRVMTKQMSSACHDDRFDTSQWMAEQEYCEGCHYWDVDTSASVGWAVGVSYPSIGRRDQLGRTANSWCLEWSRDKLCYWHNNIAEFIKHGCPRNVRLALDMTNGTLSFYSLSDSRTLLHCVEERFTEPVRPVFWLFGLKINNALSFPPWVS